MLKLRVAIIFSIFIQLCTCLLWDALETTWGINPFTSFQSLPKTEQDAVDKGWTLESDCKKSRINGQRYILNNDYSVILIFDNNGFRAGIATSLPKGLPFNVPSERIQPYFFDEGDRYVISAYFIDPNSVCSSTSTYSDAYGDRVVIKGRWKERSLPLTIEEARASNDWTEGPCMLSMGTHFWSNVRGRISEDMHGDDLFPVFLLFNKGKLNGFGWAFNADLKSSRFEHPPKRALYRFFRPVPKYLIDPNTSGVISSMHIFFDNHPRLIFC